MRSQNQQEWRLWFVPEGQRPDRSGRNTVYRMSMSERYLHGKPVTDEQIQAWADEAEAGYDPNKLRLARSALRDRFEREHCDCGEYNTETAQENEQQ